MEACTWPQERAGRPKDELCFHFSTSRYEGEQYDGAPGYADQYGDQLYDGARSYGEQVEYDYDEPGQIYAGQYGDAAGHYGEPQYDDDYDHDE